MKDNPYLLLQPYGLDQLLTDQDDPYLWAGIVGKYWPKPNEIKSMTIGLLFGVGIIMSENEEPTFLHGCPCEMFIIELWSFNRIEGENLKPVPIERAALRPRYSEHILHVSRPSTNQDTAIVHTESNPGPLAGWAEVRVWKRQADGNWIEPDEVINSWLY